MYIEYTLGEFIEFESIYEIRIRGGKTFVETEPASGNSEAPTVHEVPEAALATGDTEADVFDWLVGPDGPFPGGTLIEDALFTLRLAKAEKHKEIKIRKEEIEEAGIPTSFGVVDSDLDSRTKISGAAQMADFSLNSSYAPFFTDPSTGDPITYQQDWRLADDSHVNLDAMGMIQMALEVGNAIGKIQAIKDFFDAQTDAATSVSQVDAIDVSVDWLTFDPSA